MIVIPAQAGTQNILDAGSVRHDLTYLVAEVIKLKESLYGLLIPIYLRGYFEL